MKNNLFATNVINNFIRFQDFIITNDISIRMKDILFVHKMFAKKRFKTNNHLKRHLLSHSSVKSFCCDKCDKRFKSEEVLRNHYLVHTNVRLFNCPQKDCNKTFKRKTDLSLHQRIHYDKPFKCEECKQLFSDKNSLNSHNCFLSMQRRYECNFKGCDKKFKLKITLNQHKKQIHYRIKTHKCFHNNCDKSFCSSYQLKSHISFKHSTDRPFKCNFQQCQSSFKTLSNLNRHKYCIHLKN